MISITNIYFGHFFIKSVWGCGTVESKVKQCRKDGKIIRTYSLHINNDNKLSKHIYNSNINYDENIIIL